MEIATLDYKIARLVEIDNEINQREIKLFCEKRVVRNKLRQLRKQKREAISALGRRPGRQPTISIDQRRKQVATIKEMRAAGKKWREVARALGYKNHPECIRILRVYGSV